MLKIPYVGKGENACALACYTMIAKHFFPDTSFKQIADLSDWEPGYVVWGFKFWNWITEKGVFVMDYDLIDYKGWVEKGAVALRETMSEKEFDYINAHTKDLNALTDDLRKLSKNDKFTYHRKKPTFELLTRALAQGNPCEVVLDSHTLDRVEGFALHRVVVVDIDSEHVTFHDPRPTPRANRKESIEHFKKSWLEALDEPELCIYSKTSFE